MRLFDEHIKRDVISLNGVWNFAVDDKNNGEENGWSKKIAEGRTTIVPSCWNNDIDLLAYEGACWYEKKFYSKGGTLKINFGAVCTQADVWLDGVKLGDHYGGFCEFSFIKESVAEGYHTLTVRVDNSFDEVSIPQKRVDWWHYGGITRDVSVETLVGVCPLVTRTDYELSADLKSAKVTVSAELYNAGNDSDTVKVSFGEQAVVKSVDIKQGETVVEKFEFKVNDVRLWSCETPNLYEIKVETSTDDLFDRTGIRKVEVKKDGIYLNGKQVEIRGVNRHDEHPDWGFAFPARLIKRDMDIVKEMECNAIRGSHYPNAKAFVDYCDEQGMLFWSEIPIWGCGFSPETLANPEVIERGLEMHKEMVKYYVNHPSIIIWGMHNEIRTDLPESVEMSKTYYNYLKENGGNRVVTYASNHALNDICYEYCDLICVNWYIGWYTGKIKDWDEFLADFKAYRDSLGFENKPLIMSEFGAAAIYGHTSFDNIPWTEEYQANLLSYCINLFHSTDFMCGTYIWQMCDIRSNIEMNRARAFNNKGLVNEYRKPKMSFFKVKECYNKIKGENK